MQRKNKEHQEHGLYLLWTDLIRKHKDNVCDRWQKIENFIEDIKVREKGSKLRRICNLEPFGPYNYYWKKSVSNNPLYQTWANMKGYNNKKNICKEWLVFDNFLKDVGEKKEGHKLTRIDNNKPFGPNNFIWKLINKQQTRP